MIRCAFVAATGLMQQVTNRVRDEHPRSELLHVQQRCLFSPFRGKLHRPDTAGY
jgi:hypothetical protein